VCLLGAAWMGEELVYLGRQQDCGGWSECGLTRGRKEEQGRRVR
jgi:hypothetical protein